MRLNPGLYNKQFLLLCSSSFLFFGSFNLIIPELPSFLDHLGGGEHKGLIISLFTVAAAISRPFSGKWTDKIGRIKVMIIGVSVSFVVGLMYPWVLSVWGFFMLRFLHGFSTGFKPPGTAAYTADVVPANRRGEAMGILGVSASLGMATFPALGGLMAPVLGWDVMFYTSSFLALLSILVLAGMRETLKNPEPFSLRLFKVSWRDVIEPRVMTPSLVLLFAAMPFGIILTIMPDFSEHVGFANKGAIFTVFMISSIMVRVFAGRLSDRLGRRVVLAGGLATMIFALILISFANSVEFLILGAFFFGLANGFNSPTIMAWAIDLADDEHRGRAMSTFFLFLEFGIGLGAFSSGTIFRNDPEMFQPIFLMGAGMVTVGLLILLYLRK